MKKNLSIITLSILVAALTAGGITAAYALSKKPVDIDNAYKFDEDNIVVSFAGITDVHNSPSTPQYRKAMCDILDKLEELNEDTLDAVVIGGDMVNTTWSTTGTDLVDFKDFAAGIKETIDPSATALFYTLGNHDADPTSERGSDCKNVGKYYFNILGKEFFQFDDNYSDMYDEDGKATNKVTNNRSMTLNGIHFISITPDYFWNSRGGFSKNTINFLQTKLKAAVADNPNMPIFVTSHSAIANTSKGSENEYWGYCDLEDYLKEYPQVIYLSGHIHNIIADDLSICQRDFTMVDLGSTKNTDQFNNYATTNYRWNNFDTTYNYENSHGAIDISSGSLFQIDNLGNVKIRRFVQNADRSIKGELDPWYIDAPKADKSHLVRYNKDYRIANNKAPTFAEDSIFLLSQKGSNLFTVISSASDDSYVEYYEFKIKTEYDELITTKRYQTDFYKYVVNGVESPNPIYDLGVLAPGKYIIELRAGDVWRALSDVKIATIEIE